MSITKAGQQQSTPILMKAKEINAGFKNFNSIERESMRIQNLCRESLRFLEEKQKNPPLTQREPVKRIEPVKFPKIKSKHSDVRKKKCVDKYFAYKFNPEGNKLKKLRTIKSVSPINRACKYYDILKPRQVTKFEKYIHLHNK